MKRFGLRRRSAAPSNEEAKVIVAPKAPAKPAQTVAVPKKPPAQTATYSTSPIPGLSGQHAAFFRAYMTHRNATQAAKDAGYSQKTARHQGARLLANVAIAAEIRKADLAAQETFEIDRRRVLQELANLAFANMQNYMRFGEDGEPVLDFSGLTADQAAALQEVTVEEFVDGRSDKRQVRRVKFKLSDKAKSLELLMRNMGMLVEKHEHKHEHSAIGTLLDEIDQAGRASRAKEVSGVQIDG